MRASDSHQPVINGGNWFTDDDWLSTEDSVEDQDDYRRVWAGYTPTLKDERPNWNRLIHVLTSSLASDSCSVSH